MFYPFALCIDFICINKEEGIKNFVEIWHCFQSNSPCFPSSSSLTSSAQPRAPPPPMALVTPAPSAHPREAHLMETVRLDSESVVWSPPRLAAPASPQTQPTSETPTIRVPTPRPVLEHVPTPSRRSQMTSASWDWISRPWLDSTPAPVELVVWMTLRFLEQLDMILQPFVEPIQDTTVGFSKHHTSF